MRARSRALVAAILVVLAAGVSTVALRLGDDQAAAVATVQASTTTTTTTTTTAPPATFTGALAEVPEVALYESPGAAAPFRSLPNPTVEGVPLVFLVVGHGPDGWYQVRYNQRPNGATAWIHRADAAPFQVPNRVVVSVGARQLTVYRVTSDQVLFQAPVAVGTPGTPTPLGEFYVDIVVGLSDTTGPYGAYQLSVAGFSEVLMSFGGGQGQIAIHGTNRPDLIGGDVSNGCVRMNNEDIAQLVPLAPSGTPVSIVA